MILHLLALAPPEKNCEVSRVHLLRLSALYVCVSLFPSEPGTWGPSALPWLTQPSFKMMAACLVN